MNVRRREKSSGSLLVGKITAYCVTLTVILIGVCAVIIGVFDFIDSAFPNGYQFPPNINEESGRSLIIALLGIICTSMIERMHFMHKLYDHFQSDQDAIERVEGKLDRVVDSQVFNNHNDLYKTAEMLVKRANHEIRFLVVGEKCAAPESWTEAVADRLAERRSNKAIWYTALMLGNSEKMTNETLERIYKRWQIFKAKRVSDRVKVYFRETCESIGLHVLIIDDSYAIISFSTTEEEPELGILISHKNDLIKQMNSWFDNVMLTDNALPYDKWMQLHEKDTVN